MLMAAQLLCTTLVCERVGCRMSKRGGWEKHLSLLVVLLIIAGIIGICWGVHRYAQRQERKAEEDRRRTEELVQGAEDLLAEHEALFERVAEVLTKQEGPLEISCQWEERQRRAFLDDFRSPEDLEPGFTDTLQELFALLPSWGNIYYHCDDRALISVYYDHIYFVDDTGTIMLQASLDYDGTEWSVGTEMYGLV